MKPTSLNIAPEKNTRSSYYKRQVKFRFASKRAEVVAWATFFFVGVAYFVTTLFMAAF